MKFMDPADFQAEGLLQEVNRQFLHPLGLKLAILVDEADDPPLFVVIDDRDDPEGVVFEDGPDYDKAAKVAELSFDRWSARFAALGWIVQPLTVETEP